MIHVRKFEEPLCTLLPATCALLKSANFIVHEKVSRVTLHGSRGLAGGFRLDSDIDLSLIVEMDAPADLEPLLCDVLHTTAGNWQSPIEADLAVIFDLQRCGLTCFERSVLDRRLCAQGGVDCFGLYKNIAGRPGFITSAGVEVKQMYPCLTIYRN